MQTLHVGIPRKVKAVRKAVPIPIWGYPLPIHNYPSAVPNSSIRPTPAAFELLSISLTWQKA